MDVRTDDTLDVNTRETVHTNKRALNSMNKCVYAERTKEEGRKETGMMYQACIDLFKRYMPS